MIFLTVFVLVTVSSVSMIQAEDTYRSRAPHHPNQSVSSSSYGQRNNGIKDTERRATRQQHQSQSRQHHQAPTRPQPSSQQNTEQYYQYRPYSAIPAHIKQLLIDAYTPQVPYVDKHSFFYGSNGIIPYPTESQDNSLTQTKEPSISYRTSQSPSREVHSNNRVAQQGGIKYKDDNERPFNGLHSRRPEYTKRSPEINNHAQSQEFHQNQNHQVGLRTPTDEIQQILHYQAMIPYNVLADQIVFQLKKPFIPQPLPDDLKQTRAYPSKIYYIKSDGEILDEPPAGVEGNFNKY